MANAKICPTLAGFSLNNDAYQVIMNNNLYACFRVCVCVCLTECVFTHMYKEFSFLCCLCRINGTLQHYYRQLRNHLNLLFSLQQVMPCLFF